MARAGDESHGPKTCQGRREKSRGDHAGLLRRLPGNARGDRDRERAAVQEIRRRELRGAALPQRQRARHAGDLADGAARAQGLGVSSAGRTRACGAAPSPPLALSLLLLPTPSPMSLRRNGEASPLGRTAKETPVLDATRRPAP